MKRNCEQFVEDISAFASDTAGLSAEAAAHIQNCARCREKLGELQAVAAMHREAAGNLAEPKRHLDRRQLERALTSAGSRRRNFEIRWRPVLGGAVALALIIGGVVTSRTPRGSVEAGHRFPHEQRETKVGEESFEPTMLALHHEVEGGREHMLAGTTGDGIRHYRVKDVETELRN
jgi:predicted anti-sigma-YlaC factor YlaD